MTTRRVRSAIHASFSKYPSTQIAHRVVKARGFKGAGVVATYVEMTLTIGVPIDAEYSSAEHADDIIENVKQLFPAADGTVHEVQSRQSNKPKREMRYRRA